MAMVAREILVNGVEVKELMAFRIEFLQFRPASLRKNRVAGVAVAGLNLSLSIRRLVQAVVAPEAAGPPFVTDVVGIGAPVRFHLGEEIVSIDALRLDDQRFGLR